MGWKDLKPSTKRFVVYGSLIGALWGLYVYQPWEIELVPRELPKNNPPVDPDSKALFANGAKVLIITAHPDDSEFYTGGALARLAQSGADLHQIICTDGDKGYYIWEDSSKNREIRRSEALNAARAWNGRTLEFMGYSDGRLAASDELVDALAGRIREMRPDYILAFDPDYPPRARHKDHRIAGVAAVEAAARAHYAGWLMLFATRAPNFAVDISDFWEAQKRLLAIHKSQFHDERLKRVTNMIEERAIEDGEIINKTYGEGFRCIRAPGR